MQSNDRPSPLAPGSGLVDLDRATLAVLGREWMLHAHLQDRVGIPLAMGLGGPEMMQEVSIEEWMAASPVYTRRIRRAMGITGDDVEAIFKALQFDIGFPHQFLDVRYHLEDPQRGTFQLASCGALMDIEPLGEELVHTMCHTIEDPTFDATGTASNPRARVRPLHRPPRVPADRSPHCAWTVALEGDSDLPAHPNERIVASSLAATVSFPAPRSHPRAEPGGWDDYTHAFDPDFELEDLSHTALQTALAEFAMAGHLLAHGFLLSIEQRFGHEAAHTMALRLFTGLGALTSQRLSRALRTGTGADGIARLLRIHPILSPAGYVDTKIEVIDGQRLRFALLDCPATREADGRTWFTALGNSPGGTNAFTALVQGADPHAHATPAPTGPGEHLAFDILADPTAPAAPEPSELSLAKLSTGARFQLRTRRPVRTPIRREDQNV